MRTIWSKLRIHLQISIKHFYAWGQFQANWGQISIKSCQFSIRRNFCKYNLKQLKPHIPIKNKKTCKDNYRTHLQLLLCGVTLKRLVFIFNLWNYLTANHHKSKLYFILIKKKLPKFLIVLIWKTTEVKLKKTTGSLLAFTCGTAYSWSSPVIPKLNGDIDPDLNPLQRPISSEESSWIAGILALGSTAGPVFTFHLSDKIGRKKTMLLFAVAPLVSYVTLGFAENIWIYYVAR